jgi:hypothetical protein
MIIMQRQRLEKQKIISYLLQLKLKSQKFRASENTQYTIFHSLSSPVTCLFVCLFYIRLRNSHWHWEAVSCTWSTLNSGLLSFIRPTCMLFLLLNVRANTRCNMVQRVSRQRPEHQIPRVLQTFGLTLRHDDGMSNNRNGDIVFAKPTLSLKYHNCSSIGIPFFIIKFLWCINIASKLVLVHQNWYRISLRYQCDNTHLIFIVITLCVFIGGVKTALVNCGVTIYVTSSQNVRE